MLVELKQSALQPPSRLSPCWRLASSAIRSGRPRADLAVRRLLPPRRRRDVRRRPEAALGNAGAARRSQPHHAGDAAARRPRRAHDAHRRRNRRQGERRSSTTSTASTARALSITRWPRRASRRRRSTSCSRRTCTSITPAASRSATRNGRLRPRFPRAQYVVRRGEWEDATHPHERNRASYLADNFLPLADAGVLQLVDDDQTIMPGVTVRRTGGHTMHHQMVLIESGGKTRGLRRRSDADDRARAGRVDHGLRSVSDGHARREEAVREGSRRPRDPGVLRARSGDGRRLHPGNGRQALAWCQRSVNLCPLCPLCP